MFYRCRRKHKALPRFPRCAIIMEVASCAYLLARGSVYNGEAYFSRAFSTSQSLFTDFVEVKSRAHFLPRRNSKGIG